MPTYSFRCERCARVEETLMSIHDYCAHPPVFVCCAGRMGRYFPSAPGLGPVSDDHYIGLRAPDGTDISSRAKHRAFMRQHNLTTADDFSSAWKGAERERVERMAGHDPSRKRDIADAIEKLGG